MRAFELFTNKTKAQIDEAVASMSGRQRLSLSSKCEDGQEATDKTGAPRITKTNLLGLARQKVACVESLTKPEC